MATAEANILIRAVDRVTAPIQRINAAVDRLTGPLRRVTGAVARLGDVAGLGKLGTGLHGVGSAAGRLGSQLGGMLGPLTALGGAASIAGLTSMVTDFATSGDEISKFARQVGLSTEALQELQYAADRQGVSQDVFNKSMGAFSKRLGELRAGSGGLYTLLKKVNPEFAKQLASAESTEDAFGLMMQAINNLEDPQKRAALASAAFSRAGMGMIRMAEAGSDGLSDLRQDARDLGIVISTDAGNSAESFVDSMTRFKGSVDGLSKSIAGSLLPVIQPLLDNITEWIIANREVIAQNVHGVVERLADALKSIDWGAVLAGFKTFIDRIQSVVEGVGGWENALIGLVAVMNADVIGAVAEVGAAFGKLGTTLLANPILAIIALIAGAVYAIYANWDHIVQWFQDKLSAVTAAFDEGFLQGVTEILKQFHPVRLVADAINGLVKWLFGVDLYAVGGDFIARLWDGLREKWDKVTAWLSDAVAGLVDWLPDIVKDKLGLDLSVSGGPAVPEARATASAAEDDGRSLIDRYGLRPPPEPAERSSAPGEVRAITDRVVEVAREVAAPAAAAASLALAPPAAAGPASIVPTIVSPPPMVPAIEMQAAALPTAAGPASIVPTIASPPPMVPAIEMPVPAIPSVAVPSIKVPEPFSVSAELGRGAGSAASMGGGSDPTALPPVYNISAPITLTVNGQVEADAIRKAVEEAVRQAMAEALAAQAADDRASLYD